METKQQENGNQDLQVSKPSSGLNVQSMDVNNIDDLEGAEAAPIELSSEYWTPTTPGETKKVLFHRIGITPVLSNDGSGEVIDLECAFFFVKENGAIKQISNGSKRLVGALQAFNVQYGAALEIRYEGKKRNKSNSFMSDSWVIKPLVIKTKAQ